MSDLFKSHATRPAGPAPAPAPGVSASPVTPSRPAAATRCGGPAHDAPPAAGATAVDPVCGMSVTIDGARHTVEHGGATYYFCCAGCRTKFLADPARYLAPPAGRPPPPPADPGAVYICPMCPGVCQIGPGTCPICGMALEPEEVTLDHGPNPELLDMRRRLWIALVFTVPLVALEMGGHLSGVHLLPHGASKLVQLALATPVVVWAGWPFLARGWASLRTSSYNMFTLIALGTVTAYGYSIVATLLPHLFPPALAALPGGPPVYFEAAAVITALVLVGQVMELRARDRTGDAIRALLRLAPATAIRVGAAGRDEEVALSAVAAGDRLRVRPGDTIPLDGTILDGRSDVDQSMVTGEAMPVARGPGDAVIGGTTNGAGGFVMRADKVGRDTLLARIVGLVSEAQRSRAPVQRLADQVAGWFVPLVVATAALAFLAWWAFGPEPRLAFALVAAVSVLVIACPCALGLATPMSIMVGLGRGARAGVLFRSADALERLEKADTLVVDKTGTLTEGRPSVVRVHAVDGVPEADLVRLAASAERASEHPLARAVVAAAAARGIAPAEPRDVTSAAGGGVTATVEGRQVVVGNARYLAAAGVDTRPLAEIATRPAGAATATEILVAVDGRPAGILAVADRIKPSAARVLADLGRSGVRVVMLTGDSEAVAASVAATLGIAEFEAGVLPEDKARVVARLKSEGRVVAMAGDGVNDAPALATADIGIAMGTGSGVAIESAGVTLVGGDLAGLARARRLSVATMRNIRQNLAFAFGYNALGVPVAAGVLYPVLGILLSPVVAAAAMSLSSVSVIANALRLGRVRLDG